MPISASGVGRQLAAHHLDVSTRRVLAYNAVVGTTADGYMDDASLVGIVALPAFCVVAEWPLQLGLAASDLLGASPEERLRGVHAGQDSTFHRVVRPGDRLITTGTVAEIRSTRAGACVDVELETRDAESGALVVVSRYLSIYRGVAVDGPPAALDAPRPAAVARALPAGAERIEIAIPRTLPHLYSECADIWNPIHTERAVALRAGLPDIILHGTATWALACRELVECHGGGDPARLRRLVGRFSAMVIPGTIVTLEHARVGAQVVFAVRNAAGDLAISAGLAVFAPPG